MKSIVTFGEIMGRIEMEHQYRFEQALPGTVRITFAGAEANVATSLAYMGREVQFVTALPKNPISKSCLGYLHSLGVKTDHVVLGDEGRMGLYFLEAGANQRPSNVIYDRDYSSVSLQNAKGYDWQSIFSGSTWFHISGITPAISQHAAEATIASVQAAKDLGLTISCDLNFRKKLWRWCDKLTAKELAKKTMQEILPSVDMLIGNEEDAADVLGIHPHAVDVHSGRLNFAAYREVAKEASRQFPQLSHIAFTLRESISASHNNWGALMYETTTQEFVASPMQNGTYTPYEIRSIVDRVGGGDAFSAGLIYAFTDPDLSKELQTSLDYATAASCLCHSIHGDINYSSPEEIIRLMKGDASGRVVR